MSNDHSLKLIRYKKTRKLFHSQRRSINKIKQYDRRNSEKHDNYRYTLRGKCENNIVAVYTV